MEIKRKEIIYPKALDEFKDVRPIE